MKKITLIALCIVFLKISLFAQTVTTGTKTNITTTSATLNGTLTPSGFLLGQFEYGETLSYGFTVNSAPVYTTTTTAVTGNLTGLKPGTTYYYRLTGSPDGTTYNIIGDDSTFTTDNITQASDIIFSSTSTNTTTATWTNGGGDSRIVFAKAGTAVDYDPVDGTTYTANTSFGSSTEYGTGNYVLANGTSNTVNVTNLIEGETYFFKVFEYTGAGSSSAFRLDGFIADNNPNSVTTLTITTPILTTNTATNITTTSGTFNANISSDGNATLTEKGFYFSCTNSNPEFGGSDVIKKTSTGTAIGDYAENLTNLKPNKTYYYKAFATNSQGTNYGEVQTLTTYGIKQAHSITYSNTTKTQTNYSLSAGTGTQRIIIGTAGASISVSPQDSTTYEVGATFGTGTDIGSNHYVIAQGTGTSGTIYGLTANSQYTFKVFEATAVGDGTFHYQLQDSTDNPLSITTAKAEPTVQAFNVAFANVLSTSLDLSWTRGDAVNNDSVIVLMCKDIAIANYPTDGETYAINDTIGSSDRVIYKGTGTGITVTDLTPGTSYYFRAFEFNNGGAASDYLQSSASNNPNNTTTILGTPIQATDVSFTPISNTSLTVNWINDDGENAIVLLKAKGISEVAPTNGTTYSANSDLSTPPPTTGAGNYVVYNGSGTSVTLTNLNEGSEYTIKVYAVNNSGSSTTYNTSDGTNNPNTTITTADAPSLQINTIATANVANTSMDLSWTNTNNDSLLIVANTATIDQHPVNGNDYKLADAINGGTVIYKGTGTSATISGLMAGTLYHFRAYSYNNPESYQAYNTNSDTDNPISESTLGTQPSTQASKIYFSNLAQDQVTISWTRGDGDNCILIAREATDSEVTPTNGTIYTANTAFGIGTTTGGGNYTVYNGNGSDLPITITALDPNVTYHFKAYEYNNSGIESIFLTSDGSNRNPVDTTTLKALPSTQASDLTFTAIGSDSMRVSWTRGNGDGVILVGKLGSAISGSPSTGDAFTGDANFGGSETIATDEYVLYSGSGTSVDITNLTGQSEYHFKAFEYNNPGSDRIYLTDDGISNNPNTQKTLDTEPTQADYISFSDILSNSATISWQNSAGDGRIVVVQETNVVDGIPTNGVDYTANASFELGDNIAAGQYVVYNGTGTSVSINNLTGGSSYSVKVFNYNNSNGAIHYNSNDGSENNPRTVTTQPAGAPTVQASEITFPEVGVNTLSISCTKGNGNKRIIALKEGDQGTITGPSYGIQYAASTDWSAKGDQLGSSGYYIVYNGFDSIVNITSLNADKSYWVQIFEYNNTGGNTTYLSTTATNNPTFTNLLEGAPTGQAHSIVLSEIKSGSINLTWTNGNGANRICLANTSNTFSTPTNNTSYNGSATYGSGDQLSSGDYVVFSGSANTIKVTGLSATTEYFFKVIEYNNSGAYSQYYTTDTSGVDNPNSGTTLGDATWDGSTSTDWNTTTNWSTDAVPTASESAIIPNVSNLPIIGSGTLSVENLTINSGAALTISDGATLNVTGDATLKSPTSSGSTGQIIITGTGSLAVSGTSTFQRYVSNDSVFISSPSGGASFANFTGYTGDLFDETKTTNGGWTALTSSSTLGQMESWFIHRRKSGANRLFSITGAFNTGNQSKSLSKTNSDQNINGWNMVGNPYPCAIDIESAGFSLASGVDEVIYVYNNGGSYSTYVKGTGSSTNGGSRYIPAMQGFWLHANTNGASINLTNECRVNNTVSFRKKGIEEAIPQITLNIESSDSVKCEAKIEFREGYSDKLDTGKEAFYLKGGNIGLYSQTIDNYNLAINTLSMDTYNNINENPLTTNIGIYTNTPNTYTIEAKEILNISDAYNIYLYDTYFNEYFDLRKEKAIRFLSNSVKQQFVLHITPKAVTVNRNKANEIISTFISENTLFVKSDYFTTNNALITVFDITGRVIASHNNNNNRTVSFNLPLHGTYIIRVIADDFTLSKKVIYNK